jgi:hypothetical protein
MIDRDVERDRKSSSWTNRWRGFTEVSLENEGLSLFRRAYRWLNLTLVQQGIWPLLIVVLGAPISPLGLTPLPWYWGRLAGPAIAALLALGYLAQRPRGLAIDASRRGAEAAGERDRRLREQVTILVVGVAVAVAILRLWQGPTAPVLKLLAYGVADVAAFQAISFGVVGRSVGSGWGRAVPVAAFALSWGLRDLFLAVASPTPEDLALTLIGGAIIGLAVGAVSFGLRLWPGGYLAASAAHFLLVYLILGFLG